MTEFGPPLIAYGDTVMFVGKDRKTFLRTLRPNGRLQTHFGIVAFDDLIGTPYGSRVDTHLGHEVWIFRPSLDELIRHLKRESQIIFPKDLGYILMKMGVQPGVRVLEAGTGSGGLTLALAMAVGAGGHVYSYDRRDRMQQKAIENLTRLALTDRVRFVERDIAEGFDEREVDALFLDVPNPWDYLLQAYEALQGGGVLGCIIPTINQVVELVDVLHSDYWFMVEVEELLLRQYKTVPARIRPDDQMVGHTGYLVFARKILGGMGGTLLQDKKEAAADTTDAPAEDSPDA